MKNKQIWWVLVIAMSTANSSFAAGYVPPKVVPWIYNFGWEDNYDEPSDPTQSAVVYEIKIYNFADGGARLNGSYKPDDGFGSSFEAWHYSFWTDPNWPMTNSRSCWWEQWHGGVYTQGLNCYDDATLSVIYEYADTHIERTQAYSSTDIWIQERDVSTQLAFWAGGVPGVTRDAFITLTPTVYDVIGQASIPSTNVIFWAAPATQRCDSNGSVYAKVADNAWYDCTPQAYQAGYSNYTFNVVPAVAYLGISRGGTNIADRTNTVIVGEQIALTCQFVDAAGQPYNVAPVTNFQWTVPGSTVSNYVPSTPSSLLHSNLNLTNASTYFYWYRPGTDLEVQCTAISKGMTMTAKAKFNVIRPTHSISPVAIGPVAVDTNWHQQNIALHFGDGRTNANAGVEIYRTADVAAGEWEWLQLISWTQRKVFCSETSWWRYDDAGLDVGFPYPFGDGTNFVDTPGKPLIDSDCEITISTGFTTFLMFRPPTPSIWVPVKQVDWTWSGESTKTNGTFQLVPGSGDFFSPLSAAEPDGFPIWDHVFVTIPTYTPE